MPALLNDMLVQLCDRWNQQAGSSGLLLTQVLRFTQCIFRHLLAASLFILLVLPGSPLLLSLRTPLSISRASGFFFGLSGLSTHTRLFQAVTEGSDLRRDSRSCFRHHFTDRFRRGRHRLSDSPLEGRTNNRWRARRSRWLCWRILGKFSFGQHKEFTDEWNKLRHTVRRDGGRFASFFLELLACFFPDPIDRNGSAEETEDAAQEDGGPEERHHGGNPTPEECDEAKDEDKLKPNVEENPDHVASSCVSAGFRPSTDLMYPVALLLLA